MKDKETVELLTKRHSEEPECTLQQAIERLWDWQHGGTSFSCLLFTMMQKADANNFPRLVRAFPVQAMAFAMWLSAPSEDEFFDEHMKEETT